MSCTVSWYMCRINSTQSMQWLRDLERSATQIILHYIISYCIILHYIISYYIICIIAYCIMCIYIYIYIYIYIFTYAYGICTTLYSLQLGWGSGQMATVLWQWSPTQRAAVCNHMDDSFGGASACALRCPVDTSWYCSCSLSTPPRLGWFTRPLPPWQRVHISGRRGTL